MSSLIDLIDLMERKVCEMKKKWIAMVSVCLLALPAFSCCAFAEEAEGTEEAAEAAEVAEPVTYEVPVSSYRACEHSRDYLLQEDSYEATDTEGGFRHYVCSVCGAEYSYETAPMVYTENPKTGEAVSLDLAVNPYLPNYELMPDNELHVFWSRADEEWRVYGTGSHDSYTNGIWCGDEVVCWSAPVYDLTDWRYEGIIKDGGWYFACDFNYDLLTDQAIFYAFPFFGNPEMESYHLWINGESTPGSYFAAPLNQEGVEGIDFNGWNFDPAIYIEPDGTIYLVYDKQGDDTEPKHCMLTKLKADRSGIEWSVGVRMAEGEPSSEGFNPNNYEANTLDYLPEYGVYVIQYSYVAADAEVNGQGYYPLAYIYTAEEDLENALWHWGGIIGDNGGFYQKNLETGVVEKREEASYSWDNNHGSLVNINGDWYLSNHRHTAVHACRQGFIEKVSMSYEDGVLTIDPTEYTSSIGESIDAYQTWPAYIACYITPAQSYSTTDADGNNIPPLAYITSLKGEDSKNNGFVYDDPEYALHRTPIVNLQEGVVVGFKYLDFGQAATPSLTLLVSQAEGYGDGIVEVYLDAPTEQAGGTKVAELSVNAQAIEEAGVAATGSDGVAWSELGTSLETEVEGVHGVYFVFQGEEGTPFCDLDAFTFAK